MNLKSIKILYVVAGLYDLILGFVYFFAHERLFTFFDVPSAGHPTYVEFPAILLVLFGVMFLQISSNPVRHRAMIPYGIGLKAAFSGLAFWYEFTVGVSDMWIPMAVIDLLFLTAFVLAWRSVARIAGEA
ncbi:MAG TPA: hypothetical protein DIU07_21680 [Rhodobacteraceae bacterium]|nr:hypothetical protein [Paracoccaceae bacterium]